MFNIFQNGTNLDGINKDRVSELMMLPEVAAYLGIGRDLAYQFLNDGDVKGFKIRESMENQQDGSR